MTRVAVFDINETTLDLSPVREVVDDLMGQAGGHTTWFQRLLQLSMTATITETYLDLTVLAEAALQAVADADGRRLPGDAWDRVASAMASLVAHPDVVGGLTTLRDAGWTTVALTNSAPATVGRQLDHAELTSQFDLILSVDAVQAYKPAAAPYTHAAEQVGLAPRDLWMVACHDWDLAGARAVGMSTAFITRPGMSYSPNLPAPEITADDFDHLAAQLSAHPGWPSAGEARPRPAPS